MNLLRSWLTTCSSSATTPPPSPPPKSPLSDTVIHTETSTQSSSNSSSLSSSSSSSTNISIHFLLTLPSLPSLTTNETTSSTTSRAPNNKVLVSSLNPTKRRRRGPQHHNTAAAINALAIHENLLYAATGNQVHVYDASATATTTGNGAALIDAFGSSDPGSGSVKSVAFLDGKIFTSHQDCKIRVWKVTMIDDDDGDNNNHSKKHRLVATLPTFEDRLLRFAFPRNYANVRRHKKKLWIQHHDVVSGLAVVSEDEKHYMVSISWDRSLKIWKSNKGANFRCLESVKAHDDAVNAIAVSKDGTIYTGSADNKIKAWKKEDAAGGRRYELLATLEKHKSAVNALALSSDGSVLFSGSCDRSVLVWEREDGGAHMAVAGALRGHSRAVLCLINVGDLLMSGSADATVRIWRRAYDGGDGMYCCLAVLDGQRTPVRSLAAVAVVDGGVGGGDVVKVFTGGLDGEVATWHVEM